MEKELKKGDQIWLDGYTSMAQQNSRKCLVESVEYRFDKLTGDKFPIYLVDGDWYDGRDGGCYDNEKSMYYIELTKI